MSTMSDTERHDIPDPNVIIEGSRVVVTGDGPYAAEVLAQWVAKQKADTRVPQPGDVIAFVVVGRTGFDTQMLRKIRPAIAPDRCFSQEQFLAKLLFGQPVLSREWDPSREQHPGLQLLLTELTKPLPTDQRSLNSIVKTMRDSSIRQFVACFERKKPSELIKLGNGLLKSVQDGLSIIHRISSRGEYYDPAAKERLIIIRKVLSQIVDSLKKSRTGFFKNWPEQSEIRTKYGYTVNSSATLNERRLSLERAVTDLGLWKVANHIAAFASLGMEHDKMTASVRRWREDLEWLKKTHYKGEFTWPDHWIV